MNHIKEKLKQFIGYITNVFQKIENKAFIILLSITWLIVAGVTIVRIQVYDPIILIRILTFIIVTIGVYVAVWKLMVDQNWRRSEVYLEQMKELLEKSFYSLEVDSETGYPKNSRHNWLSSSRLLLAALALGDKISEPSHKETLQEYVEYWRIKFRELLDFEGSRSPDEHYFYETGSIHAWSPTNRAPIAERSIAVIHRFMQWPENVADRLSQETDFSDEELDRIEKFGAKGIAAYCSEKRKRS